MINLIRAFFIMLKAHRGQKDKAGKPYFIHPLTVALRVRGIRVKTVALLHDVIEDNKDYTYKDFSFLDEEQLEALKLLTHKKEDSYFDYIKKIKFNKIATDVKLSDLEHNSDLSRLKKVEEKDIKRLNKYNKAKQLLLS